MNRSWCHFRLMQIADSRFFDAVFRMKPLTSSVFYDSRETKLEILKLECTWYFLGWNEVIVNLLLATVNNLDSAAIYEGRPKLTALSSGIHWFVFFYLCRLSTYEDVLQYSEDQIDVFVPSELWRVFKAQTFRRIWNKHIQTSKGRGINIREIREHTLKTYDL